MTGTIDIDILLWGICLDLLPPHYNVRFRAPLCGTGSEPIRGSISVGNIDVMKTITPLEMRSNQDGTLTTTFQLDTGGGAGTMVYYGGRIDIGLDKLSNLVCTATFNYDSNGNITSMVPDSFKLRESAGTNPRSVGGLIYDNYNYYKITIQPGSATVKTMNYNYNLTFKNEITGLTFTANSSSTLTYE